MDYPKVVGNLDFEVLHISEFLAELIKEEKIVLPPSFKEKKVTYHDSCRLGRHMGVYDAPRSVINNISDIELLEMERNKENAQCCGVSSWLTCGKLAKQIQLDRLKEAKSIGADWLITSCPKCQIHLQCAMEGELPIKRSEINVKIFELPVLFEKALNHKNEKR
jgi:Fe-S oxidoreductase